MLGRFITGLLIFFITTNNNLYAQYVSAVNKVDAEVWLELDQKNEVECFILFEEQAITTTTKRTTKEEKARAVFTALRQKAQETQAPILSFLQREQVPYRPYYIVNGIWIKAKRSVIMQVAAYDMVDRIAPNPRIKNPLPKASSSTITKSVTATWGIERIEAHQLWAQGIKGAGAIVGGQDTGYDWLHPAISDQYRGDRDDHNYHWHDAIHGQISPDTTNRCGYDSPVPCDDHSHGTHTMGTMAGDDGLGNEIGVAPHSEWIGCRNMENGWGTPATYLECFEWFLAPTDTNNLNPQPSKAPHVIANSWGCPPSEGCNTSNFNILQIAVENLKNAGVVVVVSAGNDGRGGCSTIRNPAAIYEASFVVGATDIRDTLATFSSRGAVVVDGSGRMKPDVVAPGVNVRSSIINGNYASYSGTSMAGPHVAGAVALLISAQPSLAGQVDSIETLLKMTADSVYTYDNDTCGTTPMSVFPNNMVGYGRINLLKAIQRVRPDLDVAVRTLPPVANLRLYPNPTSSTLQLKTARALGAVQLEWHNVLGQSLLQETIVLENETTLELGNWPVGIYWLTVRQEDSSWTYKVIKE
ncbi:MAG: S8 family peptidase [Aureispira sp.]